MKEKLIELFGNFGFEFTEKERYPKFDQFTGEPLTPLEIFDIEFVKGKYPDYMSINIRLKVNSKGSLYVAERYTQIEVGEENKILLFLLKSLEVNQELFSGEHAELIKAIQELS